jgi:hypothetical protein
VKFVRDARTYYRIGNAGSLNNARSHRAVKALYASKVKSIEYLLSMENSARSRAACVQLLQDWMFDFYGQEDVVMEAQQFAGRLGGSLKPPVLKWKYKPIQWLFGYDAAFKARKRFPYLREQAVRHLDRLFYGLSSAEAEGL